MIWKHLLKDSCQFNHTQYFNDVKELVVLNISQIRFYKMPLRNS